jgi:sphinganine C4-monooxygenase
MAIRGVSDELLGTFVPIAVYWLYSGLYVALEGVERLDGYRLHPREEAATKNAVSKGAVVRGVLVQQAFQVAVSLTLFTVITPFALIFSSYILTNSRVRIVLVFSWLSFSIVG